LVLFNFGLLRQLNGDTAATRIRVTPVSCNASKQCQFVRAHAYFSTGVVDGRHNCLFIYGHVSRPPIALFTFCVVVEMRYFGGWGPEKPMTLKFELGRYFLDNSPTQQLSFHHPMFNRSEVIVLTNKHTHTHTHKWMLLKISTSVRYATPVENKTVTYNCLVL